MVDCRKLYLDAGRHCSREVWGKTRRELVRWMDELHQGLLVKVYLDIALSDRKWQLAERQLATALIEHVWNRRLEGGALREAIEGLNERSNRLTLRSVIKPLLDVDRDGEHVGDLETIVMRFANLVAKADGQLTDEEASRLHVLHESLRRLLDVQDSQSIGRSAPPPLPYRTAEIQATAEAVEEDWGRPSGRCESDKLDVADPPQVEELSPEERLQEALEQLDKLIGLNVVKEEVRSLSNFLRVQRERESAGLPRTPLSLHLVFVGNPGTGKTTVARIIAQLYGAMGILSKGHLVETDRSGLVAQYAGQTAAKTNKLVDEALGGVLFIDEAYSLVDESQEDAFGREALQTLLKRMEDDRHQLAVILAGYPGPMQKLLETNPGLSSRFGRTLSFEDYAPPELAQIFALFCRQNHYELSPAVRHRLSVGLTHVHRDRDEHFGNGRLVRNLFEDAVRQLANRIADQTPLTHELLTELHPTDLRWQQLSETLWQQYSLGAARYSVDCTGCTHTCQVPGEWLGRTVKCTRCEHRFRVEWGELTII